jgi:guanidinoacetate N-methyltransferase
MDATILTRQKIGFPTKAEFLKNHAIYTRNALKIAGHEIMERWETKYMKKLASIACKNCGKVLEVGFGMGISSHFIQLDKKIKEHIIIEAHPEVCNYARKMFKHEVQKNKIKLINGFWENVTPKMKASSLDGILFDTYPLKEKEIHKNHFSFFKEAHRLLKKGGILTYYSDESKEFSKEHITKLIDAGFSKILFKSCEVEPPKGCMYWRRKTIIAPMIIK